MGLIQKNICVKVNNFTEDHFRSIGYDVKNGSKIEIPVFDLPNGSGLKIEVECDYCNNVFLKAWRKYLETKDDLCCNNCKKHKVLKTTVERFGMPCAIHHPSSQKKMMEKNLIKYGVEDPYYTSKESIQKSRKTMIERYGVPYSALNKDILKKMNATMKKNGNSPLFVSKNQLKLHEIFGGILNFCFGKYFIDIFDKENNMAIEYDGGGHDLSVKKGSFTKEEFELKERIREKFLIDNNLKILRIVDYLDKFDNKNNLLSVKDAAIKTFLSSEDNIYVYNIETKSKTSFKI